MDLNIHAGQRVLYKHNGQWAVGTLEESDMHSLTGVGLFLRIIPKGQTNVIHIAEINDIFLDAQPVEDWMKQYNQCMTKEKYIEIVENDENFVKALEQAYISDGEYYYYPITKFNRSWIEKQPFDYVVRFT